MYPLGTWFVSGICVWIPCIKETMMMIIIIPFTFVNEKNAGMHFGNELCNGNTSTAVEKYQ
jgi:hypothetical protein